MKKMRGYRTSPSGDVRLESLIRTVSEHDTDDSPFKPLRMSGNIRCKLEGVVV